MRLSPRIYFMMILIGFLILYVSPNEIIVKDSGLLTQEIPVNQTSLLQAPSDITNLQAKIWANQSNLLANGNDTIYFELDFNVNPQVDTMYFVNVVFTLYNSMSQNTGDAYDFKYYRQIKSSINQSVSLLFTIPSPVTGVIGINVSASVQSSMTGIISDLSQQYVLPLVKNAYFDSFTLSLTTEPVDIDGDGQTDAIRLILDVTSEAFKYSPSELYADNYSQTFYDLNVLAYEVQNNAKVFADAFYASINASVSSSKTEFLFFPPHDGTYEIHALISFYWFNVTTQVFTMENLTRSSWYYDQPRSLVAEPLDTDSDTYMDTMRFRFSAQPTNELQANLAYYIVMDVYFYDTISSSYVYEKSAFMIFSTSMDSYKNREFLYYTMPANSSQQSMTYMFNLTIQAWNNHAFLENHVYYQTLNRPVKSLDNMEWKVNSFMYSSTSTTSSNDTITLENYVSGLNTQISSLTVEFTYNVYTVNTTTGQSSFLFDKKRLISNITRNDFFTQDSFEFVSLEQSTYLINLTLSINGMWFGNTTIIVLLDASPLGVNLDVSISSVFTLDQDQNGYDDTAQINISVDTLNTPLPLNMTFTLEINKNNQGSYEYIDTVIFTYAIIERINLFSLQYNFSEPGEYTIILYWSYNSSDTRYLDSLIFRINDVGTLPTTTVTTTTSQIEQSRPTTSSSLRFLSFTSLFVPLSILIILESRHKKRQ